MSPKIIAIVGATGTQGGSVLTTFLDQTDYHIRALTRSKSSTRSQALAARSTRIEVVSADLSDPSSLDAAFKDVSVVFGVTDWSAVFQSPEIMAKIPSGVLPNKYACDIEQQQAQNIFDAAAKVPSLERLIFSDLPHVSKLSGGKYTKSYHFDSKALAVYYLSSTLPDLWKKTSLIQVGGYLENFLSMDLFKPRREGEEIVFDDFGSGKQGDTKAIWPWVSAVEDTGPIVQALVELEAGKHVLAFRQKVPTHEFADIFSKVTGEKTRVKYGKRFEGMPEFMIEQFKDTFDYAIEFGYSDLDNSVVSPSELGIELKLGLVGDWISRQDWNEVLGAKA